MIDGGLSSLFQKHIPEAHWQRIEVGGTGKGVPDLNYCIDGVEGWIELKQTSAWAVIIRPEQIGWIERRVRVGGRVSVAVRRKTEGGPRNGDPKDELWLYSGKDVRALADSGIGGSGAAFIGTDGPARWDWAAVRAVLTA